MAGFKATLKSLTFWRYTNQIIIIIIIVIIITYERLHNMILRDQFLVICDKPLTNILERKRKT